MTLTIEQQRQALAIAPKPSAAISFFSSLYIVHSVVTDSDRRSRVYHRICLAMALNSLLQSYAHFWGTWAMPSDPAFYYQHQEQVQQQEQWEEYGEEGDASSLSSSSYYAAPSFSPPLVLDTEMAAAAAAASAVANRTFNSSSSSSSFSVPGNRNDGVGGVFGATSVATTTRKTTWPSSTPSPSPSPLTKRTGDEQGNSEEYWWSRRSNNNNSVGGDVSGSDSQIQHLISPHKDEKLPYLASGNRQTCHAQGMLVQYGFAVPCYYASLSLYALLAVRNNFDQKRLKKIEPYIHAICNLVPLGTAIVILKMRMINPSGAWCYMASPSLEDCKRLAREVQGREEGWDAVKGGDVGNVSDVSGNEDVNECSDPMGLTERKGWYRPDPSFSYTNEGDYLRKERAVAFVVGFGFIFFNLAFATSMMIALYRTIQRRERINSLTHVGKKRVLERARRMRSRVVLRQAGMYLLAFYGTYVLMIASRIVQAITGTLHPVLHLAAVTVVPLQGFLYLLVYARLRVTRIAGGNNMGAGAGAGVGVVVEGSRATARARATAAEAGGGRIQISVEKMSFFPQSGTGWSLTTGSVGGGGGGGTMSGAIVGASRVGGGGCAASATAATTMISSTKNEPNRSDIENSHDDGRRRCFWSRSSAWVKRALGFPRGSVGGEVKDETANEEAMIAMAASRRRSSARKSWAKRRVSAVSCGGGGGSAREFSIFDGTNCSPDSIWAKFLLDNDDDDDDKDTDRAEKNENEIEREDDDVRDEVFDGRGKGGGGGIGGVGGVDEENGGSGGDGGDDDDDDDDDGDADNEEMEHDRAPATNDGGGGTACAAG